MTTTPPRSPPLPAPPIAQTPGPHAIQFQRLFADALSHTLRTCSYAKFAACFPTPAAHAAATLESVWRQITDKVAASAHKEFEEIMAEREVVAGLNELERLVGEARGRAGKGGGKGDGEAYHTLPPERLYLAHLAPYLREMEDGMEAELKRLEAENEEMVEGIHGQGEEVERLVAGLEAVIADLENANGVMGARVEEGGGIGNEALEVDQELRVVTKEARL